MTTISFSIPRSPFQWQSQTEILLGPEGDHGSWYIKSTISVSIVVILFIHVHVVYKNMSEAVKKHPEADVLINFASLRSAFDATMEAMSFNQVRRGRGEREGVVGKGREGGSGGERGGRKRGREKGREGREREKWWGENEERQNIDVLYDFA